MSAHQWVITVPKRTIRNAAVWLALIVLLTGIQVWLNNPPGLLGLTFAIGWIFGRELNR